MTDPTLSPSEQQRVITAFSRGANRQTLRVAFRLPQALDADVERLIDKYLRIIDSEGVSSLMLPPLIHNRPALVAKYGVMGLWMPARAIPARKPATAYSVHTMGEAIAADHAGGSELMFGHVFATDSHPGEPGRGIAALQQIAAAMRMEDNKPAITAIGGIHEGSIRAVGGAGVRSVACIRAISRSRDIPRSINAMHDEWSSGYADFHEKGLTHDR